jgi:hypothetical protein
MILNMDPLDRFLEREIKNSKETSRIRSYRAIPILIVFVGLILTLVMLAVFR